MADDAPNPRIFEGANHPPAEANPFEAHRVNIEDLYTEACNWADGEPIANEEQAAKVQEVMRRLQEAAAAAEADRVKENEPFDTGKAAVQAKYNPLIADTKTMKGKAPKAIAALKVMQRAWLIAEQARIDQEAAAKRAEADRITQAAAEAAKAAAGDLAAQDAAEEIVLEARSAQAEAKRAETTTARASGGYGRASSLRDNWVPHLRSAKDAAAHFWTVNPKAFDELLIQLAKQEVSAGKRSVPGFDIVNEPVVV